MNTNAPHTEQPERLLKDTEIAAQLGISRRFVHTLKNRGVLRSVRLGHALRFPLNANLAALLDGTDKELARK